MRRRLSPVVGLMRFAALIAGAGIFIAPFRGTAGFRATLLAIAALAIVDAHRRSGQLRLLVPPDLPLRLAVAAWVLCAIAWSFVGPAWLGSLATVKGDIVIPIVAFLVFYALTRTRRDFMRWVWVLAAGLVVLTAMVIREPYDPSVAAPEPAYVTVGWLTLWLVVVAPALVVPLFASRRGGGTLQAVVLVGVSGACLLVAASLSGNRVIWACFAAMVVVATALGLRGLTTARERWRLILIASVPLLISGVFLADSMRFRVEATASAGQGPISFMLNDSRVPIWREALAMIGEHPLAGFGYANPDIGDAFSARFDDPVFRQIFRHAHNVVLDYTLQMGVTGGIVVVALFAALAWAFFRRARARGLARLAGLCGIALVTGVFLRNMTDDFFARHGILIFAAVAGMFLGLGTHRPPLAQQPPQPD